MPQGRPILLSLAQAGPNNSASPPSPAILALRAAVRENGIFWLILAVSLLGIAAAGLLLWCEVFAGKTAALSDHPVEQILKNFQAK